MVASQGISTSLRPLRKVSTISYRTRKFAELTAAEQANRIAEVKISIDNSINGINNFYFITFTDTLLPIYQSYRYGIEEYNSILCKGIKFIDENTEDDDILEYNTIKYGTIKTLFDEINENFMKNLNNDNTSSSVAFSFNILYSYIFKDISYNNKILNINNASLQYSTYIENKVPIYVNWGQLTPKMMYYMELNKKNNYPDYLINFGPCYIDELYRLNNLVYNLHYNTVSSNSDISNLTIIYAIIDGNFYNTAFNYFYNYAKNITLIDLPNFLTIPNPSEYNQDASLDIEYSNQINSYYNNKKVIELSHNSIHNHPNVVLINIPIAETQDEYNKSHYGNAINKSLHLIEKYYKNNSDSSNNYYIYIKTHEISNTTGGGSITKYYGEYELLNAIHSNTYINNILKNQKIIISSYNNIEYTLKNINTNSYTKFVNLKNKITDISYLNILSSYNINYTSNINNILNLNSINNQYKSTANFNKKSNNNLSGIINLSTQKEYLGLLDSNLMNYLINKVVNNYSTYNQSFSDTNPQGHDITGELIYNQYKNLSNINANLSIFKNEYKNNNYINNIFQSLINNYSGSNSINFSDANENNSRIKNFSLYNIDYNSINPTYYFNKKLINNSNIEINSISNSDNDKFENLISSIFYEKFYLKDTSTILDICDNYLLLDNNNLKNIIDLNYSIYNNISNDNPLGDILNRYPNVSLKIIDLCNITIYKNYNNAINDVSSLNINELMEIRVDPYILYQKGFSPYVKLQLEFNDISNVYNDNNISLISNISTFNIKNSLIPRVTINNPSLSITIPKNTIYVEASLNNYDICFNNYIIYSSDYYDKSELILNVPIIEVSSNLGKITTIDYTVTDPCNNQIDKNLDIIVYNNTLFDISNIFIEPTKNLTINDFYSNIIIHHNNGREYNYLDISNQYICDLCYNITDTFNIDAIINTHEISYNILNIITDISISGTKNLYISPGESFQILYENIIDRESYVGIEDIENIYRNITLGIQDTSFIYPIYDISSILDLTNLTNNINWDICGSYEISGNIINTLNSKVFTLPELITYNIVPYSLVDISINSNNEYHLNDIIGIFNNHNNLYNELNNINSNFSLKLLSNTPGLYRYSEFTEYSINDSIFPNTSNKLYITINNFSVGLFLNDVQVSNVVTITIQ